MKRCLTLPLLRPSRIVLLPDRAMSRCRCNPAYPPLLRRL